MEGDGTGAGSVEDQVQKPTDLPSGKAYAVARWRELNEPDAPWWTRSQGIGIRLRLRELLDIGHAHSEGAAFKRSVDTIRAEACETLLHESSFLRRQYGNTAAQLGLVLEDQKSDPLAPGTPGYSTVEAALKQLDGSTLWQEIAADLGARAEEVQDERDLEALGELVELLDGELADEGFSPEWRYRVASTASKAVAADTALDVAIKESVAAARKGWPKPINVIVPVDKLRDAEKGAVTRLRDAKEVTEQLSTWLSGAPIGEEFELGEHAFTFELEKPAADLDAAVRRASEWLEQELALYKLQGGGLEPADEWLVVDKASATTVSRPKPLRLAPDGLKHFERWLTRDPTTRPGQNSEEEGKAKLADAFAQLAQARHGSSGAALSDIWTVVEAVFAGAATEGRRLAGDVMAELLEYLYPLALLEWMGKRLQGAGLEREDDRQSNAAWALDQLDKNFEEAFKVAPGDTDPLLYVRRSSFGKWSGKERHTSSSRRMGKELEAVSRRCERVAARAYLVRNFQVHRAQPHRATALAATLPVFAEMARVALGYVAENDLATESPVSAVKFRLMRIRQVAWDFKKAKKFGGGPLREALASDIQSRASRKKTG